MRAARMKDGGTDGESSHVRKIRHRSCGFCDASRDGSCASQTGAKCAFLMSTQEPERAADIIAPVSYTHL